MTKKVTRIKLPADARGNDAADHIDDPDYREKIEERIREATAGAGEAPGEASEVEPCTLDDVLTVYNSEYCEPDRDQFVIALGTVAANLIPDGDPVWTLNVNPPSAGKTEAIRPLAELPFCHEVSVLTEAALLSGSAKKDRDKDSTGGLLREMGDFGVLLLKDFTSVLSMDRTARATAIAALREVFDGEWTRMVGTDGGRTLRWRGKMGFIGATTNAYDSHHAVIGAMGDRFLLYRAPIHQKSNRKKAAHKIRKVGQERQARAVVARAVGGLFAGLTPPAEIPALPDEAVALVADVALLVTTARSTVERDGRTREIELVHESEAPMRLAGQLATLWHGLRMIGLADEEIPRLIVKIALDSMPPLRYRVIKALAAGSGDTAKDVAVAVDHPYGVTRRTLEDLAAHKVLTRHPGSSGPSDSWELRDWARQTWEAATWATIPKNQ
jgi:hypothetical protein